MILIEKDGERQRVNSLEGYEGWTVVDDEWVEDSEAKEQAKERARLRAMDRFELIAEFERRIQKMLQPLRDEIAELGRRRP